MDATRDLIVNAERLLELARMLERDNAALRARVAQLEAQSVQTEKRLAAARTRIETLIERLPETDPLLRGS